MGLIGQFQCQLRFCRSRCDQKARVCCGHAIGEVVPAKGTPITGNTFGFHQFIDRIGLYLERQLSLGVSFPLGEGQAPRITVAVPLIQSKGHSCKGRLILTIRLVNGNDSFPRGDATAATATAAANGGAVVFVAAQQDRAAIKTDAVTVTARLMVNNIRRIGQNISIPAIGINRKLYGKSVCVRVKAGDFQRFAGSSFRISGFLIFI